MPRAPLVIILCALCVFVSCQAPTESAPQKPKDGFWVGDELSFVYRDGVIESLEIHAATCSGDDGCSRSFEDKFKGQWAAWPTIAMEQGVYQLDGIFSSLTMVSGGFRWGDPDGACCVAVGAWAAQWTAPLPNTPGADAGSGGGGLNDGGSVGEPGSVDWQGASLGSLHPGPANSATPMAGSEAMESHQQAAHESLATLRAAVGAGPIKQNAELAKSAQAHAEFFVKHHSKYKSSGLSPHDEDASFGEGFTGVKAHQRMKAAGYTGTPGAEVMAFTGTPAAAVQGWLETVYHRLPLIDPSVHVFGYGGAKANNAKCEVINFSGRAPSGADPIIVYPWPGQTGVPKSWSGNEGPQPPPPPSGYPSGPVITARVPNVSSWGAHTLLTVDGAEVPHVFLSSDNDPNMKMFDSKSVAIYANDPLPPSTEYEVRLEVTIGGNAHTLAWRFTTAP